MRERYSNIELLRIFTMIGVIILHYNNATIGGALKFVDKNSINFYTLYFLEAIFICAVNVFLVISGYFLCNSNKRNFWKPIELLIQVICIYFLKYIIVDGILENEFNFRGLIVSIIPANYFVILYIVVYLISPYINIIINNLNEKSLNKFILLILCIFSIYPTIIDVFIEITDNNLYGLSSIGLYGSQYGYTCINFIMCYIIGSYIRKNETSLSKIKIKKLIIIFCLIAIIITIWSLVNDYIGYNIEKSALEYCNPLIIINAGIIFTVFKKMNLKNNKIINNLAKSCFMIYLVHDIFLININIQKFVNNNIFIMLIHIIMVTIIIYIISYIINILYESVSKKILKKLEKKINLTYTI